MNAQKAVAGLIASVTMSAIWYLASPSERPSQGASDLAALRTPITVTLVSGESIAGELQGADSLCADWSATLQASPETVVLLPDGRAVTGTQVAHLAVGRSPVAGLEALGSVSACPPTMTVRLVGSPAVSADLTDVAASAAQIRNALKSLQSP